MIRTAPVVTALVASAVLSGCALDLEEEFATAVVTSSLEAPKRQTAGREIADAMSDDCQLSAAEAVKEAAARPSVGLYPSSCVDKTADGDRLHAEFNGCTGAFGKVKLNGGVDAVVSLAGDCRLHADVVDSGDLTANGEPFDYEATAEIEVLEGARAVEWKAHWFGTTPRGRDIEQRSDLDVLVDHASSCIDLAGTLDGTIGKIDYGVTIKGLSICPDACPASGTVDAYWKRFRRERHITIEFDGSDLAQVTGWTGREFEVEMVCDPGE